MKVDEFAQVLNMPVEDMVSIGEKQALNPASLIYKNIKLEVGKKFAAVKATNDIDKKKREKVRVYVQHVVSSSNRYTLTAAFPHWDIKFANAGLRSAPMAKAVYTLMTEYLFSKVRTAKGNVLAWGVDLRSVVMRSRDWVHLCVPGHEMSSQFDFLNEDRSIVAMVNAACSRGRDPGLPKRYAEEKEVVHCTTPTTCTKQALVAVMLLHKTDTNLRQIANYMHVHGVKLLYYVIPGGKHMELCTQGEIPELDAYALPTEGGQRIDIVYKQDQSLTHSYTYSNYLELVARSEVRMFGKVFRKEMDNSMLGTLCYKVTCFEDAPDIKPTDTIYRSWVDPDHDDHYMVYAPVLSANGHVSNPTDWEMVSFPVRRDIIDDVHDAAMRAQGVTDIYHFIARRLNSKTSTVVVMNQIVQRNKLLAVSRFDLLVLVIYCSVFMRKYADGKAVSTLAPHARDIAEMSRHGTLGMFSAYTRAMFENGTAGLSEFMSAVRKFYYTADSYKDLPLPAFLLEPGYVEYSDVQSSNPRFKSWNTPDGNPTYGFSMSLPGAKYGMTAFDDIVNEVSSESGSEPSDYADPWMFATGEAIVKSQAALDLTARERVKTRDMRLYEEVSQPGSWIASVASFVSGIVNQQVDLETLQDDIPVGVHSINSGFYKPASGATITQVVDKNLRVRPKTYSPEVDEIVNKVLNDNKILHLPPKRQQYTAVFAVNDIPEVIPGFFSDSPASDIQDALGTIFPGSTLMNTQFYEADRAYGDSQHLLKGPRLKIDLSKMMPLKPEQFYLPIVRGHVLPDVKSTPQNVLHMLEKRNANTPDSAIPLDELRVITSAWRAYLEVFCKPGTEEILKAMPYIGPDEESCREWVTRLPEAKRKRLAGQDGYSVEEMDLARNNLLLKPKLKPNLGASYATSVKAPQGIQYDATGKTTATLSPVIGGKVEREQTVLKHNVLILQRKSVDDIVTFLNGFDWRPNERGERYYLEGDYEAFDKSQGVLASKLHWYKCAKFGVLPELVEFLRLHNQVRSVSAIEAGIKMFLDVQRGSGHPDTLDGNNDVNEMVLGELLLSIIDRVEFIIIQGDDVIVAMRGTVVDVKSWEFEISRRYNLSIKLSIQKHGYICSYDIVHLPDGHSVVVADVVKRALSFLSVSKKNEEDFPEQYTSFVDNMRYIEDTRVQQYLARELPKRMKIILPNTTSESIMLLCKACSALKRDYKLYRSMFSEQKILRNY